MTAFVRGRAADRPLLLVLDDLHLAGASTLELLHLLLRRLAGDRVRAEEGAEALAALADVGRGPGPRGGARVRVGPVALGGGAHAGVAAPVQAAADPLGAPS